MTRRQPGELVATFYGSNIYAATWPARAHWRYEIAFDYRPYVTPATSWLCASSLEDARHMVRVMRRREGMPVRRARWES